MFLLRSFKIIFVKGSVVTHRLRNLNPFLPDSSAHTSVITRCWAWRGGQRLSEFWIPSTRAPPACLTLPKPWEPPVNTGGVSSSKRSVLWGRRQGCHLTPPLKNFTQLPHTLPFHLQGASSSDFIRTCQTVWLTLFSSSRVMTHAKIKCWMCLKEEIKVLPLDFFQETSNWKACVCIFFLTGFSLWVSLRIWMICLSLRIWEWQNKERPHLTGKETKRNTMPRLRAQPKKQMDLGLNPNFSYYWCAMGTNPSWGVTEPQVHNL